jgi:hypothetical protein
VTAGLPDEQRAVLAFVAGAARTSDDLAARFGEAWIAAINDLERAGCVSRRVTQSFAHFDVLSATPRVVIYELTSKGERSLAR